MTAEQQVDMSQVDAAIDAWKAVTEEMTGRIVEERQPWVSSVTGDVIKHFAFGTDDDNPLVDRCGLCGQDRKRQGPGGRRRSCSSTATRSFTALP